MALSFLPPVRVAVVRVVVAVVVVVVILVILWWEDRGQFLCVVAAATERAALWTVSPSALARQLAVVARAVEILGFAIHPGRLLRNR